MNIEQLAKHNIKPQTLAHKILAHLNEAEGYVSCAVLRSALAPLKRVSDIREQVINMQRAGLVLCDAQDRAALTKVGIEAYSELGLLSLSPSKKRSAGQKKNELMRRPIYEPKELGRTCFREGAYDAYELPSLMNGRRVLPTWRSL